jgi:hypothetical protein
MNTGGARRVPSRREAAESSKRLRLAVGVKPASSCDVRRAEKGYVVTISAVGCAELASCMGGGEKQWRREKPTLRRLSHEYVEHAILRQPPHLHLAYAS